MNFDENLHDRRIVNKCNLNLTFHFQIISLNNQGIYIFMVDWLGLAALSRLWIKTDGFSSLLALLLQMLPPLSRVKHSDGQKVSNFFFEGFPYFVFIKVNFLISRNLKIFLAVASFFEQISVHGCVSIKLPLDIFGLLLWVVG